MQLVRYLVVLVTGFLAGSRAVDAVQAWKEWHGLSQADPSAADGYRTFFLVDLAVAALSLTIAGLVWWLLRPKARESSVR